MTQDSAPQAATILVVDDNEGNRLLAESTLVDEGHRVVVAKDGHEGLAAFEREHPDCVLLDASMPGLDGFATCERIRALPGGPGTPILFLTAHRDVDTFDRALAAGADDFLTKPVRPTELAVRVQNALRLRRVSAELREHYELLRQQRDDLLRLQLQKERLMTFLVHDLKNPVNAMDLHAQLLLRDRGLSESAREAATRIRADARQLSRMILNLLDISKAEEGRLFPRVVGVDFDALVVDVFAELAVSAELHEVRLESGTSVAQVRADPDLLRRALINLVENAVRHAPGGTAVRVGAEQRGEVVELRVADAGSGIPPEMRERVFDAFVQVDTGDVARTGRGLGLAFCRLVAEAHGGRIWVEDGAPGAVFCLALSNVGESVHE